MPNFVQIFKERGNISFVGMRDTAISLLPKYRTRRIKLYDDLERGKGILDDDDHLNMYLHSFGRMHKAKLDLAIMLFVFPDQVTPKKFLFLFQQ